MKKILFILLLVASIASAQRRSVLSQEQGGTGDSTRAGALKKLLPDTTGHSLDYLSGGLTWQTVSASGSVTFVALSGSNGISILSGSPITGSGTIGIGLGDITPNSVAAVGTVTGSNLSGTNTGDQTITLTGDVTGSGTSSFATSIANNAVVSAMINGGAVTTAKLANSAVTYGKMQNVAANNVLLGGSTAGNPPEEIPLGRGLSFGSGLQVDLTGTANQIVITNGVSSVTLSTPQNIGTGSSPTFAALALTNPLSVLYGGTGFSTFASNGVMYGNGTGALQALAVNSTATKKFLSQINSGTPTWSLIANTDVSGLGTLSTQNGTFSGTSSGSNTGDQDLSGLVPNTTTVNGHALSSNVTVTKSDVSLGSVTDNAQLKITSNLSDLNNAVTARTNLGLGTLATQSGTFSGTSSGTNTGDQTSVTGNAGTATALLNARNIYGNSFDGTSSLAQIVTSVFGGTGNGFTKFSGPASSEKTFTLPNASAAILTDNSAVTVAQGGTGTTTLTAHGVVIGNGTSAVNVTAAGTSGQVLQSGGSGADPTWVNSVTQSTLDLNNVWTVHDDATNHAGVLIAATAKPGSPQYTYTVQAGDIPVNSKVTDYRVFFSIGGKNTDVTTRTLNFRFTLNGTDIGSSDQALNPTTISPWWYNCGYYSAAAIAPGDILGVKMWASVTNVVDYRDVTIYVVPRTITPNTSANIMTISSITVTSLATGANAGVNYITNASTSALTTATDGTLAFGNVNGQTTLSPIYYQPALTNVNGNGSTIAATQTLASISGLQRYFMQWTIK